MSEEAASTTSFAEKWWEFISAKSLWEDDFCELLTNGEDYDKLGTDDYDASLEIYGASDDWRLTEAQQRFLFGAGFARIYVNHKDGWQTHYTGGRSKSYPIRGWCRRYVSDPTVDTTRVIAGPPDNGYYEISYWPEDWGDRAKADLERGYYRIVPDLLDPFDAKARA